MKPVAGLTFLPTFATMSQLGKSPVQRKSTHYLNAILITSLALFMLGFIGLFFISFQHEQNRIKERIRISVFLNDALKTADIEMLRKKIEAEPYVKSTLFISKEDAAKAVKEKFDEDISEFLDDYNPLPASIEVYLESEMVHADSIAAMEAKLMTYTGVKFTKADAQLVTSLNRSFRIIGIAALAICVLFLIISITIVDKTIRLSMYSNRFIIRSMQLVGATRSFVTKPYVTRSVINGLISALLAIMALTGLVFAIQAQVAYWDFSDTQLVTGIGILALILVGLGILITWISTRAAVHKYIKMRLDDLY
ncbi:MAG: cell division protein FtsX [Chitinophagales bacterium]